MSKTKINWEDEKENLRKYLKNNLSYQEVSLIYNVSDDTIRRYALKFGIGESNNSINKQNNSKNITKDILENLIKLGLTQDEIASNLNTTQSSITRYIKKFNINFSKSEISEFKEDRFIRENQNLKSIIKDIISNGCSYEKLSRLFHTNSFQSIKRIANKFGFNIPDKKSIYHRPKDKLSQETTITELIQNTEKIEDRYLPVPLNYTYFPIISIKLWDSNNHYRTFHYFPEEGKFLPLNTLKTRNITLDEWECRWILRLSPDLLYSNEWVEAVIKSKYNDRLPYTKEFIKNSLRKDHNYVCDFFILKEDLIYSFKQRDSKIQFDYDFSLVPNKLYSPKEYFQLIIPNEKVNWKTNYYLFIKEETDYWKYAKIKMSELKVKSQEEFIKESINKFGKDKFDYSEVNYINNKEKVKIFCKDCNKYFWISPANHLHSEFGCFSCARKYIGSLNKSSKEDFIEKAIKIHGNLYNYSKVVYLNCFSPVLIIDNETGEEFYQSPANHLKGCGNPSKRSSNGERLVKEYLKRNFSIKESELNPKTVKGIFGRTSDKVIIDFIINHNNREIWIEYNGIQHYKQLNIFFKTDKEFQDQLQRDINVRNYCNKNNIILIEIPYILNTYEKVSEFLDKVIIEGIDPNVLIDYQSLYK